MALMSHSAEVTHLSVPVCGCLCVPVCGCLGGLVCGCMYVDVFVCPCVDVCMCLCVDICMDRMVTSSGTHQAESLRLFPWGSVNTAEQWGRGGGKMKGSSNPE